MGTKVLRLITKRFGHVSLYLIITVVTFVLFSTPLFSQTNETTINERLINSERSFREVSGLNTSKDHIISIINTEESSENKVKYGAYLSDEEAKVVDEIIEINKFVPVLREIIGETQDKPSEVASFSADFKNHTFNIYLTEESSETEVIKEKIKNSFPKPDMLQFQYVKYTPMELHNLANVIINSSPQDHNILSVKVDVAQNKIIVGLDRFNEDISKFYNFYYGNIVKVEQGVIEDIESRTTAYTDMQGGLQIGSTSARSTGSGYCTLGFTAEKNGVDYIVTAGHCLYNAADRGENTWFQGGEIVGAGSSYGFNADYDAGLIKITSTKNATNYIYKYSSEDSKYTRATNGSAYLGQPVCISGATSGFQCGEVTDPLKYVTIRRHDNTTFGAYRTEKDYISAGGDSGSPVWYGGILIGVHSTTNTFSHWDSFGSTLDIEPIVNH